MKKKFNDKMYYDMVDNNDPALLYAEHKNQKGRFFNPWFDKSFGIKHLSTAIYYLAEKKRKVPKNVNFSIAGSDYFTFNGVNDDILAFLGHSTFALQMDNTQILTDPYFSFGYNSLVRRNRVYFDAKGTHNPVVLISHNHYDHLDKHSVKVLMNKDAIFIVPLGVKNYMHKLGAKTVHELDWWQSVELNNINYTLVPSQHWSLRLKQPINTTLWGGYIIEGRKKVYFSGDTGYFPGYKEFKKKFGTIDYALLAVGASYPRWQRYYQHQNIRDFFRAIDDLQPRYAIPHHYGSIKLGKETIDYPAYKIHTTIEKNIFLKNIVKIVNIGSYIKLNS